MLKYAAENTFVALLFCAWIGLLILLVVHCMWLLIPLLIIWLFIWFCYDYYDKGNEDEDNR